MFNWATENALELNIRKIKAMIFGSTRNLTMQPNRLPHIKINGSVIPYVEQAKNLMTPSLNWQPQVTSITINKVYATLSSLKSHREFLNVRLIKQLIQTLAIPLFDYALITFMNSNKNRALALKTAHIACILRVTTP